MGGASSAGCCPTITTPITIRCWPCSVLRSSVGHRVEQHVDAERVAIGRKLVEELGVFAFPLPRVGHVGVVRGHHDHASAGITDDAKMRDASLFAALGRLASTAAAPELDVRDLRDLGQLELLV